MEPLTKDNAKRIVEKDDRRYELVPIEEWGCTVCVRSLSEPEYHDFRDSTFKRGTKDREVNERIMRACLCAACIVDPTSKDPIFTVDELKSKSAHAISIIWRKAAQLCGMDDDDISEILKNCEAGQRAGSC